MFPEMTLPTTDSDSPAPVALEATGIEKRYGDVSALEGADLSVREGECVALIGESGSGKTTLLRCFNALVHPDAGTARVRGEAVSGADVVALRRSLGYVPQAGGLLPHWSVARNVALVPRLSGDSRADERARAALERVGLDPGEFGARWPRTLSGGQRQRVALARALATDPDIILLDEPLGALDALSRAELRLELADLVQARAVTALLVTHDLAEAALLADRVAVMRGGRVLQIAPLEELKQAPAHPYVTDLLGRAGVPFVEGGGT